jgi:hypothetical protein
MEEHLIVTMFQVYLILMSVALLVAGAAALRALWRRWVHRALSRSARPAAEKKLCTQGQQPPGGT